MSVPISTILAELSEALDANLAPGEVYAESPVRQELLTLLRTTRQLARSLESHGDPWAEAGHFDCGPSDDTVRRTLFWTVYELDAALHHTSDYDWHQLRPEFRLFRELVVQTLHALEVAEKFCPATFQRQPTDWWAKEGRAL